MALSPSVENPNKRRRRSNKKAPSLWTTKHLAVGAWTLGIGWLGIILYAVESPTTAGSVRASVIGSALMFSVASVVAGGLIGFLFGVPRSVQPGDAAASGSPNGAHYSANTNLEQISDWLTKIIVGATLVQLGPIVNGAGNLFSAMGPALGGNGDSPAFAGGLVVYFGVAGFILGWLMTRLYLARAFSAADVVNVAAKIAVPLSQAEAADKEGQHDRADELRHQAVGFAATLAPAAATALGLYFATHKTPAEEKHEQTAPQTAVAVEETKEDPGKTP